MQNTYSNTIKTPIGYIRITTNDYFLLSVKFMDEKVVENEYLPPILIEATKQIEEYFKGIRKEFDLKTQPTGTEFQQKIWKLVGNIAYGDTLSYLSIAIQSGSKSNTRAVGLANGKNPIPIVIPCHRVIGSDGKLTGYAGGLDIKRWLLQHEMVYSKNRTTLF